MKNKKNIGLIIADEFEVFNLTTKLGIPIKKQIGKMIFYEFKKNKNENDIVLCFSGIGKVNAAIATSILVREYFVDLIVNIGVAGVINNIFPSNNFILVNEFNFFDVDATSFNYEINQVPKMPNKYFFNEKFNFIKKKLNIINFSKIYSGDSFINKKNFKKYKFLKNEKALIDMEATSIAQSCYVLDVNFICLKIISDNIKSKINKEEYQKNTKILRNLIDDMCLKIIKL